MNRLKVANRNLFPPQTYRSGSSPSCVEVISYYGIGKGTFLISVTSKVIGTTQYAFSYQVVGKNTGSSEYIIQDWYDANSRISTSQYYDTLTIRIRYEGGYTPPVQIVKDYCQIMLTPDNENHYFYPYYPAQAHPLWKIGSIPIPVKRVYRPTSTTTVSQIKEIRKSTDGSTYKRFPLMYDKTVESNSDTLTLTNSVNEVIRDYTIYGNSIQNGTPSPQSPVAIESVGNVNPEWVVPDGYTELEYLQSTGTQIINLNISGNARAIIDAQCESNAHVLLSSTVGATAGTWIGSYSNKDYWTVGSSIFFTVPKTTRSVIDATFSNSGVTATIGSETKTNTQTVTQGNWTLFACGSMGFTFTGKVWSCKMYQNDALVRNMIPARRNSDSEVGMYDLVSNTFFTNAGTGTFTAGPEIPHYKLPIENTTSNLLNAEDCYGSSKYTYTSSPDKATCYDLPLPNGKYLVETTVPFNDDNTASIFAQNGHISMLSTSSTGVSSTQSLTLDVTSGHLGIGIKTEGDTETYLFPTLESWQNSGYTITVTPADLEKEIALGTHQLCKVGSYVDTLNYATQQITKRTAVINSYNGETITTPYISSTGSLTTGAKVIYGIADTTVDITAPQLNSYYDESTLYINTETDPSKISCKYVRRDETV